MELDWRVWHLDAHAQALLLSKRQHGTERFLDDLAGNDPLDVYLVLSRIELGKAEQLLDQREHMLAGVAHAAQMIPLHRSNRPRDFIGEQPGIADDGRHRCAELVADRA